MMCKDPAGSRWLGQAALWTDPLGNVAQLSECTMAVDDRVLRYTWSHEGKPHNITPSGEEDRAVRMVCKRVSQ